MATFNAGKKVDDITEAKLLPEDWYRVRIVKEPQLKANKAKQTDPNNAKARDNIVIQLRVVSDVPEYNGRPFTKYLPLPNDKDWENINEFRGVSYGDLFLASIKKWVEGFGGEWVDEEFEFASGDEAMIFISQGYDSRVEDPTEDDLRNEISMDAVPQPIE